MERSDIERLAEVRAAPAVTVLLPLRRHEPGNAQDPLRLRNLLTDAERRVRAEFGGDVADAIATRLSEQAAAADLRHPDEGLAILATPEGAEHHLLPFRVPERVVINQSFATRDLLVGLQRTLRYRVLVLSLAESRLYEGFGDRLRERTAGGFPSRPEVAFEADTPHRDLPIHDERPEAYRSAFRAADRALGVVHRADPRPLVLVGPERDLAYFDEVTGHGDAVIGRVAGSHLTTPAAELAALVAPAVVAADEHRRDDAVAALVAAVGRRRAATGLVEVWSAARQGRGHLLVVDEDYTVPVRIDGADFELLDEDDLPAIHDDAIDEIAETVLRHGGNVVFVAPGRLDDVARIGLVLRY